MKARIALFASLITASLVLVSCEFLNPPAAVDDDGMMENGAMMEDDPSTTGGAGQAEGMMEDDDAMMDNDEEMMMEDDDDRVQAGGRYMAYENGVIGNGEESVLFFHAAWCPYCQANDVRLIQWYNKEQFPRSTYKIDYDTATDLRQRYGVVQQDTFILIDGSGTEIERVSFPTEVALRDLLQ